jgi:hypothetical protein
MNTSRYAPSPSNTSRGPNKLCATSSRLMSTRGTPVHEYASLHHEHSATQPPSTSSMSEANGCTLRLVPNISSKSAALTRKTLSVLHKSTHRTLSLTLKSVVLSSKNRRGKLCKAMTSSHPSQHSCTTSPKNTMSGLTSALVHLLQRATAPLAHAARTASIGTCARVRVRPQHSLLTHTPRHDNQCNVQWQTIREPRPQATGQCLLLAQVCRCSE